MIKSKNEGPIFSILNLLKLSITLAYQRNTRLNSTQNPTPFAEGSNKLEAGVWEIANQKNIQDLPKLFELFDDDTDHPEVMYSLVHAIETYPLFEGVITLLKYLKNSIWFRTMLYRTLNHKDGLEIFRRNMKLADQNDLMEIFRFIKNESPEHKILIEELESELRR